MTKSKSALKKPPSGNTKLRRWALLGTFLVGVVLPLVYWLDTIRERFYVFDPHTLHEITKAAIASSPPNNGTAIVQNIVQNLTSTYAHKTNIRFNTNTDEWVLNNAGGAMGGMYVIHASTWEYINVFGTAVGTEGHSGWNSADHYAMIFMGEVWYYTPGAFEPEIRGAGEMVHLPRGEVKQYKMPAAAFELGYARGWIAPMMPLGMLDALTSTADFYSLSKMLWIGIRENMRNTLAAFSYF